MLTGVRRKPFETTRDAQFCEACERFVTGEAAGSAAQAHILSLERAFLRRDLDALRHCFADDLAFRDHRSLGLDTADRDGLVDLVRAIYDLSPDRWHESLRTLAWNDRGRVALIHERGTVFLGGGPFENIYVRVVVTDGDRITRYELFDVDDVDHALARFEELSAEPIGRRATKAAQ